MAETPAVDRLQPSSNSQLADQLEKERSLGMGNTASNEQASLNFPAVQSPSPSKPRAWSTNEIAAPVLSPSPSFHDARKTSKDDTCVAPKPVTPKRPDFPARGLSLQMPPRDISSTSTAKLVNRVPLSPKLDSSTTYGSPASVLPRRSRGMDFSRACTNLHHSTTIAESPDSSPTIGGRGMMIPPRKSFHQFSSTANFPDSPSSVANSLWSTMANTERVGIASSVGSVDMLDCDSRSTSSDEDDIMGQVEEEDTIHMTPHPFRLGVNPFTPGPSQSLSSPSSDWIGNFSPAGANMMSFQRARLKHGRSRKSSSSASGHGSMSSPGPASPPVLKSIENGLSGGYFPKELAKSDIESRRESLSLGTNDLHISDDGESDKSPSCRLSSNDGASSLGQMTPSADERRNVIRRAVTRRGNMLPKTKNFVRIRAALQEEGAPIDTEVKREAEVIRQVRESDIEPELHLHHSQPTTTASSPNLLPATIDQIDNLEGIPEDESMASGALAGRRPSSSFMNHAVRYSGGVGFWNSFDERMRTPPPPLFPGGSSSGISDDISMDTPASSVLATTPQQHAAKILPAARSRSSTPQPPPSIANITRKVNKRRREDDLDPVYFKRRAVSPGMSLQNSPVLPQSPAQKDGGWWGNQPKPPRETPGGHVAGEKVNNGSAGSANGLGLSKRIGFQGMSDTNDGLMNMSIE